MAQPMPIQVPVAKGANCDSSLGLYLPNTGENRGCVIKQAKVITAGGVPAYHCI